MTEMIVRRYMLFPGCGISTGRPRKRFWRLIAVRKYLDWRKNGRLPYDINTKFEYGRLNDKGEFEVMGRVFNPQAAVRAYRLWQNRGKYHAPHKNQAWIDMTRIWQIKGRLNYGRY